MGAGDNMACRDLNGIIVRRNIFFILLDNSFVERPESNRKI